MKSNYRFHSAHNKKHQATRFLFAGIIAIAVLLAVQVSIPAYSLHKETALFEKYSSLEDLVHDIKNGDVDFKEFRDSDGIPLKVMKDSEIYDKMDINMQHCIDLAGKVGNELGDREIVHCSEDSGYFKSKYLPTITAATMSNLTAVDTQNDTATEPARPLSATSTSDDSEQNKLVAALVKTGKFTADEATEFVIRQELLKAGLTEDQASDFATKIMQSKDRMTTSDVVPETLNTQVDSDGNNDINDTSSTTTSASTSNSGTGDEFPSAINQDTSDNSSNRPDRPEDYNDLSLLVDDIRNKVLDANKISLDDFRNSGAYKGADKQIQSCIDLAGKVGNNLGDHEIARCSEDPNYFKSKYSSGSEDNVPASSTGLGQDTAASKATGIVTEPQANGTDLDTISTPTADTRKSLLIDKLVKSGKFTENEANDFATKSIWVENELTTSTDKYPTQSTSDHEVNGDSGSSSVVTSDRNKQSDDAAQGSNEKDDSKDMITIPITPEPDSNDYNPSTSNNNSTGSISGRPGS